MRVFVLLAGVLVVSGCLFEREDQSALTSCGADVLQDRVGTQVTDHAFVPGARIIPPGTAVTMDHRPDRLNVETDDNGVITRIYCG